MTAKKLLLFCVMLLCQLICAQHDSIALQEVIVSDVQLARFSNAQSVQILNDSVIDNNHPSLTGLLRYNSVLDFKENGFGMVSSPAFRGTSAQQTAVIWNGININSQFNGQTDFNAITTGEFNSIAIRGGGGSVIYGSSAIGGTVHLNNEIDFKRRFNNEIRTSYGSFNTLGIHYNVAAGSERFMTKISFSKNSSDNDFNYVDSQRKNENGAFDNNSLTANFGYKFNDNNFIKLYSYFFSGDRHFSLLTPTDTKSKYRDLNLRNLLEYTSIFNQFTSKIKLAFLSENYHHFEDISAEFSSFGKAETAIAKYDLAYAPSKNILLNTVAEYSQTMGIGSDVGQVKREIGAVSLLMSHVISRVFQYEVGVRKESATDYNSPLLFSGGIVTSISKNYKLKWNASRTVRRPTYNDLYWIDGGNPNLKPESSYQTEIGNNFTFKNLKFSATGYLMRIEDMIQWLPGAASSWLPRNVNNVKTYGGELLVTWNKSFGENILSITGNYAYTVSKDLETGKQLIYIPYHTANAGFAYSYRKFGANYQLLFNGEVFTRSDNAPRYNLDAYLVSNMGLSYTIGKSNNLKAGFQILNLFNANYEVMVRRPFPGRHFNTYLTFNF